jgi:hypothetical protein
MPAEVGAVYRASFTVPDGTVPAVTVTLPDRTSVDLEPETTGTACTADYLLEQEGLHKFTCTTTDPASSQSDYATATLWRSMIGLEEARDFIGEDDTTKDDILRQVLAAATEQAESIAGTCVIRDVVERIPGWQRYSLRLPRAPLPDEESVTKIESVRAGGPVWTADDLLVSPDSGVVETRNFTGFWYGPWRATYVAGRTVIPQRILIAVKEIVYDMWGIHRTFGPDDFEPDPEETAKLDRIMASYRIPSHARGLLEQEAQPGFA